VESLEVSVELLNLRAAVRSWGAVVFRGKISRESHCAYLFPGKFAERKVRSVRAYVFGENCRARRFELSVPIGFWGNLREKLVGPICFRGKLQGEASRAQCAYRFLGKSTTESPWTYLFSRKFAGRGVETQCAYRFSGEICGRSSLDLSVFGKICKARRRKLNVPIVFWGNLREKLVGPICFRGNLQGEAFRA